MSRRGPALDRATVQWVERALGTAVVSASPLPGGMSSIVARCELGDGRTVVVRHVPDEEWLRRDPHLVEREARALELLTDTDVPAPRLLAADPRSGRLAMTMLPGELATTERELGERVDALARLAARVAAVELPEQSGLPMWSPWAPADPAPPEWGDRGLWREVIAAFEADRGRAQPGSVLLHRDLHPLNVLWRGRQVSGLVDWMNACIGHPHAELSHCRWNLAVLVDQAAADRFLRRYLDVRAGDAYDTWWDLATIVGLLPGPIGTTGWQAVGRTDLTMRRVVEATESFARTALDRLPG